MVDSVSKLREELLALTGLDIQLDEETFKDPYEFYKELSEIWGDLSDLTRANVTELLSGKRGGNAFNALMTNFDIAESAMNASANQSQGSAQKELENYQKGIEYSLGKFKASFQELSTDFISSDLVKGVVDFGTGLINVLDLTIGKFGALKTVIAGLGIGAYVKDIMGFKTALDGLPAVLSNLPTLLTSLKSVGVSGTLDFAQFGLGINSASIALAGFIAVAAGIAGIVALFDHFHVSADEALDSFSKQKDSFENAKMEVDDLNSQLEDTQSKIDALEAKGNLSLVEQEDLANLKSQNKQLERTLQLREAELKLEARKSGSEAHKLYNEWTTEDGLFSNGKSNSYNPSKIAERVDTDTTVKDIVNGIIYGNYGGESRAVSNFDNFDLEGNKDNINELIAAYKSYQKQIEEIDAAEDKLTDDDVKLRQSLNDYRTELSEKSLDTQEYIDNYASVMQNVKEAYTQMQSLGIDLTDVQRKELIAAEGFLLEYRDMVNDSAQTIQDDLDNIFKESSNKGLFNQMKKAYAEGNVEAVREIIEGNEQLKSAYSELGITANQVFDYVANKVDPNSLNISAIKEQLRKAFTKGEAQDIAEDFNKEFYKFIGSKSDEEIEIFYRYVNANNVDLSDLLPEDLEATFTLAIEASGAVNIDEVAQAFNDATSNSSALLSTIEEINSALDSQSGKSIDPETYNSENLVQYRDALEMVNGTMQYNAEKVREINKENANNQISANETAKALEQQKWDENASKIEEYKKELEALDETSATYSSDAEALNAQISGLEVENSDIESRCNYLDLYNQKLRESIGSYHDWLAAQSGGEAGDMSNDVRAAMQDINNAFDSESDQFGFTHTKKFTAAVDFLVPDDVADSPEGDAAVKSYIDSLGEYFTGDRTGVDKFIQEGIDKQLIDYDPETGAISVANKTYEEFAKAMNSENGGMTVDAVQAMLGLVQDLTGMEMQIVPEEVDTSGVDSAGEAAESAGESAKSAAESFGELAEAVANSPIGKQVKDAVQSGASTFIEKARDYFTGGGETEEKEETSPVVTPELATETLDSQLEEWKAKAEAEEVKIPITLEQKEDAVSGVDNPVNKQNVALETFTETGTAVQLDESPFSNIEGKKTELEEPITIPILTEDGELTNTENVVQELSADEWQIKLNADTNTVEETVASEKSAIESEPVLQPVELSYNDGTAETPEVEAQEQEIDLTAKVTSVDTSAVEGETVEVNSELPNETSVSVDADTSSFDSGKAEVEGGIEELNSMTAIPRVDIGGDAKSQAAAIKSEIDSITPYKMSVVEIVRRTRNEGGGDLNGNAHVNGTAYNDGKWGANRTETALVGEIGRELVVNRRTGKWHTVGDNGAEFVKINKGDIVFNHRQTEDLLKHGYVDGRGVAYLSGNAYVNTPGIDPNRTYTSTKGTWSPNSSSSSSTASTKANTAATQANTAATKNDTKQKTKNTTKAKKLGDLYDWVAVRLEWFGRKTKEIADKITDYIDSATKTGLLWSQIGANQDELGANQRGADLYKVQADKVAKQMKMSSKLVNKAQTGAWQFEKLSDKDKEKVQTYLKYYDKYVDAQQKVRDLRNEQLELFEQWANMPAETASKEIDKLSNSLTLLSNAYNIATSGASALAKYAETAAKPSGTSNLDSATIARSNSVGYKAANQLLDAQLANTMSQMNAYRAEYDSTTANVNWARDNITNTRNAANAARNQVTSTAQTLLGKKAIKKALNKSQEAALASGGLVNTKGLSGNVLKQIKAYNALVSAATTASYNAEDAAQKYTIATQAQEAALQKLAESQEEYAQMIVENEKKKFENIKNFYDLEIEAQRQVADNAEKFRKYQEAYGNDMEEGFYQTQIDALNKQLVKMQNEEADLKATLESAERNGIIKGSEEWVNLNNQILAITGNIHALKTEILGVQDEMRKEVFYQALDKALKKADDLRGSLSTIRDIIADEMLFDDDGRITDFGITALAMDVKEYESYLDSMGTLLQKRQKYIDDFNDGNNTTNYSQKEFDEDMSAIQKDIQDLLKNADNARKAIIDMVVKTSKAEVDALMEAIEARKTLLAKQKSYYDYDKSLRGKTKDIQLLEQQERALQNSAAAEDKAMLARIRAQKQEAQEALDDTVRDHIYNLQVDGLDDLKTELQDNYDKYVKDLSRNLELITESVDGATQTVTGALNTVNDTVKTLLKSYGVTGLNNESIGLPKFASGSRRVGRSGYGLTNETRDEIVVGDRGVFVPLSASSAVVKPNLTDRLFGLADNYSSIMSSIGKHGAVATIQSNEGNVISPVINAPISIVGNQIDEQGVIRAINKQLPVISRTVQEDIRKDLRKSR